MKKIGITCIAIVVLLLIVSASKKSTPAPQLQQIEISTPPPKPVADPLASIQAFIQSLPRKPVSIWQGQNTAFFEDISYDVITTNSLVTPYVAKLKFTLTLNEGFIQNITTYLNWNDGRWVYEKSEIVRRKYADSGVTSYTVLLREVQPLYDLAIRRFVEGGN